MPISIHAQRDEHREAEELLPWYATGQLDTADRARVDAHLASCAACQRQVAIERQLINEFQALTPEIESGWARVRARIGPQRRPDTRRASQPLVKFGQLWTNLSNAFRQPLVATLAAAQVAFVIVAGGLLVMSRPAYQALGSSAASARANAIVMFRPDATAGDMRVALNKANASMVSGPTSAGAWLVHVDPAQRQQSLATLRSDDEVQLAEAIDGPSR